MVLYRPVGEGEYRLIRESGFSAFPLRLPEQETLAAELTAASWEGTPPDPDFGGPALAGYLGEEPVGLLRFGPAEGEITLLCVRRDCRRQGFGAQLIGQAVYHWRPLGAERLTVVLPEGCAAEGFFGDYGFAPAEAAGAGRRLWVKNIGFDPMFKS